MSGSRIRSIKPEFWTDEKISECSMSARLIFIASWNFADDQGGLDRSAKQLKAQAFPYDNLDCEPLIQELIAHGLLTEYEFGGRKYLHINGFLKHQLINRPSKPRYPVYEESLKCTRGLTEPSLLIGSDRIGSDRKGSDRIGSIPVEPSSTDAVFEHWKSVHGHPRAQLDPKRRAIIQRALKTYSVEDLCQSITGYRSSPLHQGQNDRHTVYDSIELMLRDSGHIDAGLKFYQQPPATQFSSLSQGNILRTKKWLDEEELVHAKG